MLQGRAQDGGFAGPGLPALLEFQQCRAEVRGQVEALPWAKPRLLAFGLHAGILTARRNFVKGSNYFQKSVKLGLPVWRDVAYTEDAHDDSAQEEKMKCTPGPWRVFVARTSWGEYLAPLIRGPNTEKIALVEGTVLYNSVGGYLDIDAQDQRDFANARLMAAAPLLLAAAQELIEANDANDAEALTDAMVYLRAAVLDATKEAP